jgi:hypothetical protein
MLSLTWPELIHVYGILKKDDISGIHVAGIFSTKYWLFKFKNFNTFEVS